MASKATASTAAILMMLSVMMMILGHAKAATGCNPVQLSPCIPAITSSSSQKPSPVCCARLKQQTPCICQYLKNPNLRTYVKSPGAAKVAKFCRIRVPKC